MNWRNLSILLVGQLVAVSGSVLIVTIGGLVGADLASDPALATLPLSVMVIGTAGATVFAAMLMQRIGRRLGFALGALIAAAGGALGAYALSIGSFGLFCCGVGLWGANNAFVQQYRFAAAESATAPLASRAISLVLIGAIGGALLGPALATQGRTWIAAHAYMGSMVAIATLQFVLSLVFAAFEDRGEPESHVQPGDARPLLAMLANGPFVVAVLGGVVGYGVMNLVMTATPLSMHVHDGLSLGATAWVIESHVLAMYVPSLFSGALIAYLGAPRIMTIGVVAMLATVATGLQGHETIHYWWALVLLGLGWNFLFVGSTALLVESYRANESFKAQAINEFFVFGASAAASLLAGTVLHTFGWSAILWSCAPLLVAMFAALRWSGAVRLAPSQNV